MFRLLAACLVLALTTAWPAAARQASAVPPPLTTLLESPFVPPGLWEGRLGRLQGVAPAPLVGDLSAALTALPAATARNGEVEAAAAPPQVISYAVAIGDLDGDAARDLLVLDVDRATESQLVTALSGADGEVLWGFDPTGSSLFTAEADLTGDGVEDLFDLATVRLDVHESRCDDEGFCDVYVADFTNRLQVRSGADGAVAWSREVDGAIERRYDDPDDQLARVRGAMGVPTVVAGGGGALVLPLYDDEYRRTATREGLVPALLADETVTTEQTSDVRALTLRAADGAVTGEVVDEGTGSAFVLPTADAVVVERFVRPRTVERCLTGLLGRAGCSTDGDPAGYLLAAWQRSGVSRWQQATANPLGFTYPLTADVDGDALEDLVHYDVTTSTEGDHVDVVVRSGADGRELSRRAQLPQEYVQALPDVSGDGVADLLSASYDRARDLVRLERLTSAGASLVVTESTAPLADRAELDSFPFLHVLDHEGCDLLLGWQAFEPDSEGYVFPNSAQLAIGACEVADARWTVTLAGDHQHVDTADLSGDGTQDVVTSPGYFAGPTSPFRPTLLDGASGATAWARAAEVPYGSALAVGSRRAALLYDVAGGDGSLRSVVEVVDLGGVTMWERSSV